MNVQELHEFYTSVSGNETFMSNGTERVSGKRVEYGREFYDYGKDRYGNERRKRSTDRRQQDECK